MTQNTASSRALAALFLVCTFSALASPEEPRKKVGTKNQIKKILSQNQAAIKKTIKGQKFNFSGETYLLPSSSNPITKVQNLRTGEMGELTGDIVVTLQSGVDIPDFVKTSPWNIRSVAPQIQTVFLMSRNLNNPLIDLEQLKKDPRVKTAEIEVIEHQLKAK